MVENMIGIALSNIYDDMSSAYSEGSEYNLCRTFELYGQFC